MVSRHTGSPLNTHQISFSPLAPVKESPTIFEAFLAKEKAEAAKENGHVLKASGDGIVQAASNKKPAPPKKRQNVDRKKTGPSDLKLLAESVCTCTVGC